MIEEGVMTTKERVLSSKISLRLQENVAYAEKIGVAVLIKKTSEIHAKAKRKQRNKS